MATVPPLLRAILAEANTIAPTRIKASDGTVGDTAHQAQGSSSDHNPDSRDIVHAVDVTYDARRFDAHQYAEQIRARCETGTEVRVKYLVSYNFQSGSDRIASDRRQYGLVGRRWQWRPQRGTAHRSHLHISIHAQHWVEQSTAPIFAVTSVPVPIPQVPASPIVVEDDMAQLVEQPMRPGEGRRSALEPQVAMLDRRRVVLLNGASVWGDRKEGDRRVLDIPTPSDLVGWLEAAPHAEGLPNGGPMGGMVAVNADGNPYHLSWS